MVIRKRRSKSLFQTAAIAAAVGSLPLFVIPIIGLLTGFSGAGFLFTLLWQGIYTFTVTSTVYYRLGGIRI